jgi:polysaccharide biosynthesis protein PslJ
VLQQETVPAGVRVRRTSALPSWPVVALFVAFPLWWALGLSNFIGPILAAPMALALAVRGRVHVPRGFGIWLLFVFWMTASAFKVDDTNRLIGWSFRAVVYLSATVLFLYVYNAPRQSLPVRRVALAMTAFWVVVVAGGYLGILFPEGGFRTVAENLMPGGLLTNSYVRDLVHVDFAQRADPTRGLPTRPQAPFVYTNVWGSNFALLLPFVFIALPQLRRRLPQLLLLLVLVASLVPGFLSLNRGLWLSLGVGLIYAAMRYALRGRVRAVAALVLLLGMALSLAIALPVQQLLQESKNETTSTRLALYRETIRNVQASPLLGYGAPRPSEDSSGSTPSVGTQGQLWMVLFSHGFPGLALFLGWYVWVLWRSARAQTGAQLWLHVVVLIALVQLPYYGMFPTGLPVFMVAAAVVLRELLELDPQRRQAMALSDAATRAGLGASWHGQRG